MGFGGWLGAVLILWEIEVILAVNGADEGHNGV